MVSPLESQIKKQIAQALKGKLLSCTLRRAGKTSLDVNGDPVLSAAQSYSFDGFRSSFNLAFAQAAGIPVTDARLLIVLESLSSSITPQQDDQVKVRDQWHQLRSKVSADPAGATEEWAGFEIADPTEDDG